jgi:hypothetical protein
MPSASSRATLASGRLARSGRVSDNGEMRTRRNFHEMSKLELLRIQMRAQTEPSREKPEDDECKPEDKPAEDTDKR